MAKAFVYVSSEDEEKIVETDVPLESESNLARADGIQVGRKALRPGFEGAKASELSTPASINTLDYSNYETRRYLGSEPASTKTMERDLETTKTFGSTDPVSINTSDSSNPASYKFMGIDESDSSIADQQQEYRRESMSASSAGIRDLDDRLNVDSVAKDEKSVSKEVSMDETVLSTPNKRSRRRESEQDDSLKTPRVLQEEDENESMPSTMRKRKTPRYFGGFEGPGGWAREAEKCLTCGGVGHRFAKCPHELCSVCGKPGHFARNCKNRRLYVKPFHRIIRRSVVHKDLDSVICMQCGELGHVNCKTTTYSKEVKRRTGLCCNCGGSHFYEECRDVYATPGGRHRGMWRHGGRHR